MYTWSKSTLYALFISRMTHKNTKEHKITPNTLFLENLSARRKIRRNSKKRAMRHAFSDFGTIVWGFFRKNPHTFAKIYQFFVIFAIFRYSCNLGQFGTHLSLKLKKSLLLQSWYVSILEHSAPEGASTMLMLMNICETFPNLTKFQFAICFGYAFD